MMSPRALRWIAFGIALSVQIGMVVTYGMISEWCFCAITAYPNPPTPPPYVMRFLELSTLPATLRIKGMGVQGLFLVNLEVWFGLVLALLHALAFASRLRLRSLPGAAVRPRPRIWLAGRESVRPGHVALLGCVLIGLGMAAGATMRHRWLTEAEQVFAAAMAAASAGQPLPPGVQFSMYELRGDDFVDLVPEARFEARVDPAESGDRFLDRFVVPYTYGGRVRFGSGRRYYFVVYRYEDGWAIDVDQLRRRERW
jgi:hypothetical protein